MAKDKENKNIDRYLEEMMGTFSEEEKKEAAKAGLKNLGIKIPEEKPDEVE